ncbi:hypothetical protein Sjap_025712 [Stephania japonica]|uniref:Uncharacterized protein n=1 Tax=Stephania japonica TaxID=461633 RepID=A0AAP0E296_9MAGN
MLRFDGCVAATTELKLLRCMGGFTGHRIASKLSQEENTRFQMSYNLSDHSVFHFVLALLSASYCKQFSISRIK